MLTQPVPRDHWMGFLDRYSRDHAGQMVDLIVLDPAGAIGMEAQEMPLAGIASDTRHPPGILEIALGDDPQRHLTHRISDPSEVWLLKPGEDGEEETLEIRAASGTRTLLHLRAVVAMPPF